ncbi:MAG: hypothetical protein AB1486_08605 [Planctomycetota bacterium]
MNPERTTPEKGALHAGTWKHADERLLEELRQVQLLRAMAEFERRLMQAKRVRDARALPLCWLGGTVRFLGACVLGCLCACVSMLAVFIIVNMVLHLGV